MRHPRIIIAGIGVAMLATAGGITAAAAGSSAAAGAPVAGHSAAAPTVRTAQAAVGGTMETILTTATGQPLYYYKPDTAAKSFVTGSLARLWPPLTSAAPAGTGVSGQLAVLNDVHGQQVSYNGHPLYTFIDDHAGQVTGQGVQDFFVATPGLAPVTSNPAPASTVPSAPPGTVPSAPPGTVPSAPPGSGYGY